MKWTREEPQPVENTRRITLFGGDLIVSVCEPKDYGCFCILQMTPGKHLKCSQEEAMIRWPREGIAMARTMLDELETQLSQEENDE